MPQVCIMCVKLSFVRSFYIYWMDPVISVDSTKFIHQVEHEQLLNFFPFTFFATKSLYFPTCWHHFNADEVLKMVKFAKNQLQLISGMLFRSWKLGLTPILEFPSPDTGPSPCVVWNVLHNIIQANFLVLVPVTGPGPGVSQSEYTMRVFRRLMVQGGGQMAHGPAGVDSWTKVDTPLLNRMTDACENITSLVLCTWLIKT